MMRAIPMRILVVDDCRDNARMMKVLLSSEGHEVRMAFDGPGAVETARDFRPDVTFLDLTLPGMGGPQVAAELRRDETLAGMVIVAVSGYGSEDLSSDFDGHFTKPVDHDIVGRFLASISARSTAVGVPRQPHATT
jgi:CheY-like chemotaxis protein